MLLDRLRAGSIARAGTVLVAGALVLTACIPVSNVRQQYASNTSDPCNSHRQVLVETKESFTKTIAQAAMAGAAAGALVGFLTEGDLQGALTGAAIGGLTGAAAGYFKAKHDKAKTRQELIAAIQGDFSVDNQRLDKAGQAVRGMTECRRNEYRAILTDYRAGEIDHDTVMTRKEAVDSRIEQDQQLISLLMEGSEKRAEDYTVALNSGFDLSPGALIKTPQASRPSGGGLMGGLMGLSQMAATQQAAPVQPVGSYVKYIALRSANVRNHPSKSGASVGTLLKGELVHVVAGSEAQSWKPIMRRDGKIAYVFGSLIAPQGSPQASQVLAGQGGKATMPTLDEQEAHKAAREEVSSGMAEMLAMQQEMEAEFSFAKSSTTWLFRDGLLMAFMSR